MKVLLLFLLCLIFLTSTIVQSFHHSNIPSLSILRAKRSVSNLIISTITTTTQLNAKNPSSNLNTNTNTNNNDNDQFLQWEQEEIELQKLAILDNDDIDDLSTDDDEDDDGSIIYKTSKKTKLSTTSTSTADNIPLPDYMQKTINRFESKVIDLVSMPASKLPVVAIIGMYVVATVTVLRVIAIYECMYACMYKL